MKIKTKKTLEVETEITLPAYYKTCAHRFKIYSEKNCICVTNDQEIAIRHAELPFNIGAVESTDKEFLTYYNNALSNIKKIV